jgi:A/G-specific adenine glycosylase
VEKHGGKIPKDFSALVALPGIGPYTAGAIRVFAFNLPEVLIETNIRTAYIHHFFPPRRKKHHTITPTYRHVLSYVRDGDILSIASKMAKNQDPRTWHAALMDYGSHIKNMYPNPSRRSKHHTKQSKFEGSLRQVRGAILKAVVRGESLSVVRRQYAQHFVEARRSLVKDGLM